MSRQISCFGLVVCLQIDRFGVCSCQLGKVKMSGNVHENHLTH